MHPVRYARQDCLCALMVTLLTLLLVLTSLTVGVHSWGDDFAAYINEGIAIADGDFKEQTERNYVMHTSELPEEANPDGLVYVWGYPLLLSAVYKVVGFDRTNYSSVIWFKLPAAICLSLLGGVMVLFFRRRFSLTASAMMSLLICLSGDLYDSVNNLQADVVFMFFSMLTLLLVEVFVTAIADHRSCVGIGLLYGVIAWFMREVRLNGSTVIIIALVGHVIAVLKKQVGFEKKNVCLHLLP